MASDDDRIRRALAGITALLVGLICMAYDDEDDQDEDDRADVVRVEADAAVLEVTDEHEENE